MHSRLDLATRLTQHLTQQQLRFVRLLELNAPELDEAVEHELEANPALTYAEPSPLPSPPPPPSSPSYFDFGSRALNYDGDQPSFSPADNSESLSDILFRQIDERKVRPEVALTAKYIVGNLDSNGWLTRSLPNILNDLAINHDHEVDDATGREALQLVRSLDPAGIAGENLAQTLLLQLQRLPKSQERDDAIAIISDYFREYHMRHSHKIISGLNISRQRLDAANALILSLNPKPGAPYGGNDATRAAVIIPDFIISDENGELTIQLTNRLPELTIEESFSEAMANLQAAKAERQRLKQQQKSRKQNSNGTPAKDEDEFITSRYVEARDFIQLIRQRQQTLMSVMTAIADYQKTYFETGDIFTLRPMMLKDIANMTGLDISVISRSTANKYAVMPWGEIVGLKSFFSGKVNGPAPGHPRPSGNIRNPHGDTTENRENTESLTNRQIQAAIADLIKEEDPRHPLSDEKIRAKLEEAGYDISRRTIAKYRDRADIPVARLRKKF
ncbi:MAG: RNA polymerase factor sigma-54 [Muribaculaceae bacterium]|nr:RNA polymerase factor sigma-54 [Muribaculaceae bacterium]